MSLCPARLDARKTKATACLRAGVASFLLMLPATGADARMRIPLAAGHDAIQQYLVPAQAAPQRAPLRITGDRGGDVALYMRLVQEARMRGQIVQITGRCLSACTLYLGAGNVCVTRQARLGFHGPSDGGRPLSPALFEAWSLQMATFYPEPIRSWFLRDARHLIGPVLELSGAELIRLGVPECRLT